MSIQDGETLQAKHSYEKFAHQYGVKVQSYHADNKPFGNKLFTDDVRQQHQQITFSGVGAHHQNAVAERAIRTITYWTRAMMLHAIIHWPEQANLELWPFAMDHAVNMWNRMPGKSNRLSPLENFSKSKFEDYSHLNRAHAWGCPTYVLDPRLQDGKKIPKWIPRARRGQFFGFSDYHSSRVGKIRNLVTGYISPQFHVVYDDHFTTVSTDGSHMELFDADTWTSLLEGGYERAWGFEYDDEGRIINPPPELDESWLSESERRLRDALRMARHHF